MNEPEMTAPDTPPVRQAASAPPSRRGRGVFWGLLGGCLLLFVGFTVLASLMAVVGNRPQQWWSIGPRVAVVPLEGEIFESRQTIERLRDYLNDGSVRAVVVRINSPGGAVVPAQEIFSEIRKLRKESGKPIVASLDSVAASGGYYVAAACDQIVANPGSITGSIGVIVQWFNLEELLGWARLEPQTITSGSMKDAGSPFRELTSDERAYLQSIVTQLHGQFVRAVIEGREGKLTAPEVERLADGRVFTGEQALELRLVDQLGTLQDAIELAAREGGIRGTPRTIYPRERTPGLLDLLANGEAAKALLGKVRQRVEQTRFLYRWY
ncbi:MAG TPA: signal peptide peptidase SppA [Thermoanaerobaculia bacterium]|nr:signal peptide peptidase SppA [Thermoanaerobaculia bacterium]